MAFVITQPCCNDTACIAVCPVQCIRPRPGDAMFTSTEQLYIDPDTCIDCGACLDVCPVDAIYADYDLPEHQDPYRRINADYFAENPLGDVSRLAPKRHALPEARQPVRIAVVGAGPSACYAVDELSAINGIEVTVLERLPTPFGLVRAGVAPDHAQTKRIGERFDEALARPNVTCFFNVEVGAYLTLQEILEHHHAVIWAGGAADDRKLSIPGEDLPGSHSAREFVAWYNGHPDFADRTFNLDHERAVIIGNGNVALDVARALTRPPQLYEQTDMAEHAIAVLRTSGVREVMLIARRGQLHGSYSTAELLAAARLDGVDLLARADEVDIATDELAGLQPGGITRDIKRRIDIIQDASEHNPSEARRIVLRFRQTPVEIIGDDRVRGIVVRGSNNEIETIETGLVLRAIGYRGRGIDGMPFDDGAGVIPSQDGRVIDPATGEPLAGYYCTGWIKRGANGIIGTNRFDAAETVASLLDDVARGVLRDPQLNADAFAALILKRQPNAIDSVGWKRIDTTEKTAGRRSRPNRPRVKFVTVDELLATSRAERG